MKKLSMTVAVSALAVAAPGLAAAQDANYLALRAGVNDTRQTEFRTDDAVANSTRVSSKYDIGYSTALALGRRYEASRGFSVRTEFELGYSKTEADSHTRTVTDRSNPVPSTASKDSLTPAEGDLMMTTGFVSAYGEKALEVIPNARFIFGAGGGLAQVNLDQSGAPGSIELDDQSTTYGYHLSAGWSYEVTSEIALEAMYRYQSIEDVEIESTSGTEDETRVDSHSFLAGLRYRF